MLRRPSAWIGTVAKLLGDCLVAISLLRLKAAMGRE